MGRVLLEFTFEFDCVCSRKFWKHTEKSLKILWVKYGTCLNPSIQEAPKSQVGLGYIARPCQERQRRKEAGGKKQKTVLGLDGRQKADLALSTSKQCFPWPCLLECLSLFPSFQCVTVCAYMLPRSKERALRPRCSAVQKMSYCLAVLSFKWWLLLCLTWMSHCSHLTFSKLRAWGACCLG